MLGMVEEAINQGEYNKNESVAQNMRRKFQRQNKRQYIEIDIGVKDDVVTRTDKGNTCWFSRMDSLYLVE